MDPLLLLLVPLALVRAFFFSDPRISRSMMPTPPLLLVPLLPFRRGCCCCC